MPNDTLILINSDSLNINGIEQKNFIILNSTKKDSSQIFGINKDYATLFLIPIASFLLALLFNWIRNNIKLKSKLLFNQKFLFTWVDLIKPQIIKQNKSISEFLNILSIDSLPGYFFVRVDLHLDKLHMIKSPELVQLFVTNRKEEQNIKTQLLFNWENYLSLLSKKLINIDTLLDGYKAFRTKSVERWNEGLTNFNTAFVAFLQSEITNEAMTNNTDIVKISMIYNSWVAEKDYKQTVTKKSLLDPIEPLCRNFLEQFPKNEKITQLLKAIVILNTVYSNLEFNVKFYQTTMQKYKEELEYGYLGLLETKDKLSNIRFKSIFSLQ